MKKLPAFLAVLSLFQLHAQTPYRLTFDFNRSSALISANGIFFRDQVNQLGSYKPDKFVNISAIYQSSFSATGKDAGNQDRMSVTTYDGSDFTCGPIAANYSDTNYVNKFGNVIWPMYSVDIDQHIQNWDSPSYVVPAIIAEWPGNGDVSNGMAAQLAPYTDVNGNGIYDPENGDFPDILGDAAVFAIVNDQNSRSLFDQPFNRKRNENNALL